MNDNNPAYQSDGIGFSRVRRLGVSDWYGNVITPYEEGLWDGQDEGLVDCVMIVTACACYLDSLPPREQIDIAA